MTDHDLEDQPPENYSPDNPTGEKKSRPRPKKYIVNATGHNGKPAKQKRKPTRAFVQPPVNIDPALVEEFAARVRFLPKRFNNYVRFAVANVILRSPGAIEFPEEELWTAIGRWNSLLRGVTDIDGVTQRHHGWEHVQRLRAALSRAANDPTLQGKLKWRHNQFIAAALLALDTALEKYFAKHDDRLMSADEYAGMAPLPDPKELEGNPLFRKPRSKTAEKADPSPYPEFEPPAAEAQARRDRGPQKAALFGSKIVKVDS